MLNNTRVRFNQHCRFYLSGITIALLTIILCTTCGGREATQTPTKPTGIEALPPSTATSAPQELNLSPAPSGTATTSYETLPTFVPGECRFPQASVPAECGDLIVLEDRSNPDGATISLQVAIFRSFNPDPAPDPVVYLMGGGGGDALGSADYYLGAVGNRIRATRDFIMYNQRGTRYNEPFLNCPGEVAFNQDLDTQGLSQEEKDERTDEFLHECHDNLLAQGIDLTQYNSVTNAADLNDLRIALGYDEVNYYGTSYGTRLGLTLMRYHPEGVRSVILDSVFPPQVNYPSDVLHSFMGAVNRVFQTCTADASCSTRYPNLEETFYQVLETLKNDPAMIPVGGQEYEFDDQSFLDAMYLLLHPPSTIADVPAAIYAAVDGDFDLIEWTITYIYSYSDAVATGVFYSTTCRDELGFDSYDNVHTVSADYSPLVFGYYASPSFYATCEWWQAGEADPIENEPVISDVPTLLFAGYFDTITSTEWAQSAAETLPNSYYFEFPNLAHGVMRYDDCALRIGLEFLKDPWTEPDSTCMESLTTPNYR